MHVVKYIFILFIFKNAFLEGSLKQQVGQCFMTLVYGETFTPNIQEFIDKTAVSNFILFNHTNVLKDLRKVGNLTLNLKNYVQANYRITPLIAIDQEGGVVARLSNNCIKWPSQAYIGQNHGFLYSYFMGQMIGLELNRVGINLNLAPVVDIAAQDNETMLQRCYGTMPEEVISHAMAFIEGLHRQGILTTLKHFPGLGDVQQDTHKKLGVCNSSFFQLEQKDLKPFIELSSRTDAIMVSHAIYSAIDPNNPASVSKAVLELLRYNYAYDGVVISDSLTMKGLVTDQSTVEKAIEGISKRAIEAFNAGCDILIVAKCSWADFKTNEQVDYHIIEKVVENFADAVNSGVISKERFEEALSRIKRLRAKIPSRY